MSPSDGRALATLFWGLILSLWVVFTVCFSKPAFYLYPMILSPTALLFLWNALRHRHPGRVHRMTTVQLTGLYASGFLLIIIPFLLNTATRWFASRVLLAGRDVAKEHEQGTWRIFVFFMIALAVSPGVWEELYKWWITSLGVKRLDRPRSRLQVTLCAVTSGLSFATAENLLYYWSVMSSEGLSTVVIASRTLRCIPGHVAFAVMSGKAMSLMIDRRQRRLVVTLPGIWKQMVLHACCNYFAFIGTMEHLEVPVTPGMQLASRSITAFIAMVMVFYVAYTLWTVDDEPFEDDTIGQVFPKQDVVLEPPPHYEASDNVITDETTISVVGEFDR
ncbi:PrsW family intramembrane metalloprotease [Plasmodiophora brassicae]|uniref:Uncharacterized protein n=1 Tax=Plasmodiophora brassicae TaxID=37360 RepID=A0A0G4IJZ9_PLABS|nr:hypothetical protein PBRA_004141 [Plasmodiophora brassicae]SPR00292.1 unnamed protein product [Plasmodiophora brassicae]